ncbi:MAG: response regulator [Bacteroidales bacterium]|nr:response regulator [Bacteroidales bacterium]
MSHLNDTKKSILIVDDSWNTRQYLRNILELNDFSIEEANDGAEALKKLNDIEPDCIILDILMPVMNGFEFLNALKQEGKRIPVIIISADIQQTTKSSCMELGAKAFINKPAREDQIITELEKVLAIHQ